MTSLDALATPALLLDQTVLLSNLNAMRERMARHGVALRPHLKTAKSARIAELAIGGNAGGITVSTLKEAAYFFDHGITDITYAVVMAPSKLGEATALQSRGARLTIIIDSAFGARAIAEHVAAHGMGFCVLIEVDTGDGRSGVLPESELLLDVGQILDAAPGVEFRGVLTHAGHSYHCRGPREIRLVAREERDGVIRAAQRLRAAGLPSPVVSAGSTPTAVHAELLEGVTEMRPGVFMFNDLQQLALGACTRADLALSVFASVIAHNRHAGHLLLDAGGLALSKDVGANEFRPELGYGEVCDADLVPLPNLFVSGVSQEHGRVPMSDPRSFDLLPIGAKVRILPNHACLTAAAYDTYHVIKNGVVVDRWDRINGW